MSIDAPEIVIPTSSTSKDVVIVYLGELSLSNAFFVKDIEATDVVLYEESQISLSRIEVYRYRN